VLPALEGGESFAEIIQLGVTAYWDHVQSDPAPHQLTYELTQYALRSAPEAAAKQYDGYLHLTGLFLAGLAEQTGHEWTVPLETLSRYLLAMIEGVTFQWLVDSDGEAGRRVLVTFGEHLATLARPIG
jgi:hypothetical protein